MRATYPFEPSVKYGRGDVYDDYNHSVEKHYRVTKKPAFSQGIGAQKVFS